MLEKIITQLQRFPLNPEGPAGSEHYRSAAVLVALTADPQAPEVILTRRADHLNSHVGEVAFPGGMWDPQDSDLLHTALRESWEEIALPADLLEPLAMLPVSSPKRQEVLVTPFVALLREPPEFIPEPGEIESVFSAPLSLFCQAQNYAYFDIEFCGERFPFPCVDYHGYRIWGFTLRVLTELVNETLAAGIELKYPDQKRMTELRELSRGSDEKYKMENPL